MANKISLNDIPVDIFLDYFNSSNSMENVYNTPVMVPLMKKPYEKRGDYLFPCSMRSYFSKRHGKYPMPQQDTTYYIKKKNQFIKVNKPTVFNNIYQLPIGSNGTPTKVAANDSFFRTYYNEYSFTQLFGAASGTTPDSNQYVYDFPVPYFINKETKLGSEIDYITKDDGGNLSITENCKKGIEYFQIYMNSSLEENAYIIYKISVDTEDDYAISITLGDIHDLDTSESCNWFGAYSCEVAMDENDTAGATFYIKVFGKKVNIPKTDSSGNNLYRDADNILTIKDSYKGTFYTHQNALRHTYAKLSDKIGWMYKESWKPRQVGLLVRGKKEVFGYYNQYTKKTEYTRLDISGLDASTPLTNSTIPYNIYSNLIEDGSVIISSDEYRQAIYLNSIDEYSNYDVYVDSPTTDVKIGDEIYAPVLKNRSNPDCSKPMINGKTESSILNIYARYGYIGGIQIPIKKNDTVNVSVAATIPNNMDIEWLLNKVNELYGSGASINRNTFQTMYSMNIFNIDGTNPYMLVPMFLNRNMAIDYLGKFVSVKIAGFDFQGKIVGDPNNINGIKVTFDGIDVPVFTGDELGLDNTAIVNNLNSNEVTASGTMPYNSYKPVTLGSYLDLTTKKYYTRDLISSDPLQYEYNEVTSISQVQYYYKGTDDKYYPVLESDNVIREKYYTKEGSEESLIAHSHYYTLDTYNQVNEFVGTKFNTSETYYYEDDEHNYHVFISPDSLYFDSLNNEVYEIPVDSVNNYTAAVFSEIIGLPTQYYIKEDFLVSEGIDFSSIYYLKVSFDGSITKKKLSTYLCEISNVHETKTEKYYVTSTETTSVTKTTYKLVFDNAATKKQNMPSLTQYNILKENNNSLPMRSSIKGTSALASGVNALSNKINAGLKMNILSTVRVVADENIYLNNKKVTEERTKTYTIIYNNRFRIEKNFNLPIANNRDRISDYAEEYDSITTKFKEIDSSNHQFNPNEVYYSRIVVSESPLKYEYKEVRDLTEFDENETYYVPTISKCSLTEYIQDPYDPTSSYYFRKTTTYEMDLTNSNEVSLDKILSLDTLFGSLENTIQKKFKDMHLYEDDSIVKLRGQYIDSNQTYNKRLRQLRSSFLDILEGEEKESIDLSKKIRSANWMETIYNYSKGFLTFLTNDNSLIGMHENIEVRPLYDSSSFIYNLIISETTPPDSDMTTPEKEYEDISNKINSTIYNPIFFKRSLIDRLNDSLLFPMNSLYERYSIEKGKSPNILKDETKFADTNIRYFRMNKPNLNNSGINALLNEDVNDFYSLDFGKIKLLSIEAIKTLYKDPGNILLSDSKDNRVSSLENYRNKITTDMIETFSITEISGIEEKRVYSIYNTNFNNELKDLIDRLVSQEWEVYNVK